MMCLFKQDLKNIELFAYSVLPPEDKFNIVLNELKAMLFKDEVQNQNHDKE
jgi:hypothetical protein